MTENPTKRARETRRTQQMRAKKHLWEAALEAMRQEKRARVDEVEVVQEHSLQLMSRVAEPGTSAPITIWARLQAPKRILTLEAEARFLHEALRTRQLLHCNGDWSKKKKLMSAPAYHRASKPEQAHSLLRRLLWVAFALLIGALWSWFTEFARPCRPTGASSPSLSRLWSTHG